MATQLNAWTVTFVFEGIGRKIRVPVATGFDGLHQLVRTKFNVVEDVAMELLYVDSATNNAIVLEADDDIPSLLSQHYKWKVLDTARDTTSGGTAGAADDSYDKSLEHKMDKWMDLIPSDWDCKTKVQKHPFFISYRQASETEFARTLFNEIQIALMKDYTGSVLTEESRLEGRHAFLDAECLSYTGEWGINFMSGLFHSSVIILLCSDASMKRMLEADKKPDNCLLEWELALQMKREKGHDILPVLLSSREETTLTNGKKSKVMVDFSTFDLEKFPGFPHAHALSPGLQTVRETVKMILELNGPKANPENDVMKIVTEAREVYSRRKVDSKSLSPSQVISLSRSNLAELEKWLSPLSEIMDLEREALLKNVLSGSREWLLKKVFKFLSPDDRTAASSNRVMWLKGVTGVGKSVMAAMVARELQAQNMLGGLFFCKHDDERRSSARNLILTLVFGLARFNLQFGEILLQVKQANPDILSKSMFEMMKVLLVQPLKKVVESKKLNVPVVLVVDALEESSVIGKRVEILLVFQELDRLLPDNVKMLVTGRPEVDIVKAFEKIPFEEIEPTAEENTQDQIEFTRHFLRSLNAEQSVVDEGSEILVSKSAGIFVWLVTACTYLQKLETEETTLEQIKDLPKGDKMDGSIDSMYDRMFNGMLQSIKADHLDTLLSVLSTIVFAYEPLTADAIVSLLDKAKPENVMRCIRLLDPILVLDGSTKKIRIFHKSVKDYLTTPERCKLSVQIDPKSSHCEFARLCISALNKNLKFNLCDLPFSDFHSEIPDFDEKVEKGIPDHVKYAVKHFWEHCFDASSGHFPKNYPQETHSLQTELQQFLEEHGHHFLEACSLLDSLNLVLPAMTKLQSLVPIHEKKPLCTLIEDMKRVVQTFLIPLKASALQVYFTAVPFAPSDSEFFKAFVLKVPRSVSCPKVVKGQLKSWPSYLNILEGHSGDVNSAAFSPDGQFVVSGSEDSTIRIWNASTGQELHKLEGHSSGVHSTAFSPDGQFVVSGSDDMTVRIWNASTGQELHTLEGHYGHVRCAAFSPDGQFVVSGSEDNRVRIWNSSTGKELHILEGHSEEVLSASFSPDGQFVVSGSWDRTVRIWNASTGQEVHKLKGHSIGVYYAAFSPDGQFVVSGGLVNPVQIWNAATGQEMQKLEGHSVGAYYAVFSPDGQFVVSGGLDNTVRIWNASTGQELQKLEGRSYFVKSAAFSPDGQLVLCASSDKTVRIWTVSTGQELRKLEGHSSRVNCAAFSPDGQFVVSGSGDNTVMIWNASTGQELQKLEGHSSRVYSAAFSPDGQFVVSGGLEETVRIWNAFTGQEVHKLEGHSSAVCSTAFSPDGQFVVSGGLDNTVRIWNSSTGQELHTLEGHSDLVYSAAFSPNEEFVVSGSRDRTVRIWNPSSGQELHKLDGFSFTMSSGFTADGQSVVLQDRNYKRIFIKLRTGLPVERSDITLTAPNLAHNCSARNSSGQWLLSGEGVLESVINDGVWFISDVTKVCCWLPLEFRGDFQLLSQQNVFTIGEGISSFIEF